MQDLGIPGPDTNGGKVMQEIQALLSSTAEEALAASAQQYSFPESIARSVTILNVKDL
jgi:hypothetical protein